VFRIEENPHLLHKSQRSRQPLAWMYSKVNYAKWHDPSEPLPRI